MAPAWFHVLWLRFACWALSCPLLLVALSNLTGEAAFDSARRTRLVVAAQVPYTPIAELIDPRSLMLLCTNPVSILSVPIKPSVKAINPLKSA